MTSFATKARAVGRGRRVRSLLAVAALAGGLAPFAPTQAATPSSYAGVADRPDAPAAQPAPFAARVMSGAEKLRRLDIMLMVTALRCRTTADNFNADYGDFTSSHLGELNAANAELRADLAHTYGAAGANRALDRLSTMMANSYGQGHPWLTCADLKMVAHNLAAVRGRATLEEAADQLLATTSPQRLALAGR